MPNVIVPGISTKKVQELRERLLHGVKDEKPEGLVITWIPKQHNVHSQAQISWSDGTSGPVLRQVRHTCVCAGLTVSDLPYSPHHSSNTSIEGFGLPDPTQEIKNLTSTLGQPVNISPPSNHRVINLMGQEMPFAAVIAPWFSGDPEHCDDMAEEVAQVLHDCCDVELFWASGSKRGRMEFRPKATA